MNAVTVAQVTYVVIFSRHIRATNHPLLVLSLLSINLTPKSTKSGAFSQPTVKRQKQTFCYRVFLCPKKVFLDLLKRILVENWMPHETGKWNHFTVWTMESVTKVSYRAKTIRKVGRRRLLTYCSGVATRIRCDYNQSNDILLIDWVHLPRVGGTVGKKKERQHLTDMLCISMRIA